MKIHVPDLVHKHKHVKTKYVHVFHPKVVHSDHHSSIQFLHSRHDPNIGLINGGYPQPLLNLNPSKEYRINEEDFFKWRREQQRRAQEKRRQLQQQQQHKRKHNDDDEYEENGAVEEDEDEQPNYDEELYKKHKANKASSSSYRKESKHKNHNYSDRDYDSSNSDRVYARGKPSSSKQKQRRPSMEEETAKKYRVYGVSNVDAESSNVDAQYLSLDPTAVDPGYYSTLPKNIAPTNQDDIYSGLLAKKYNKEIAEKSKLLADINYSRKQQTKNLTPRKGQEWCS